MEIQFDKPSFQYKPGMYLFINIPEVSKFQWHPFTITSTPEEGFVSIHVRLLGNWTKKAAEVLGCFKGGIDKSNMNRLPTLRIDGPFGAPAEDLYNYKVACLIGAGIGVTPAAALLKSIWYRHYRQAPMSLEKFTFSGSTETKTHSNGSNRCWQRLNLQFLPHSSKYMFTSPVSSLSTIFKTLF